MFVFFFDAYAAIIGDIVDSKQIKNRKEVQEKLKKTLTGINQEYSMDIASDFMITLGDEFQGLLKYGKNAVNIITEIQSAMEPVRLRFGLGIGRIDTEIDPDLPLGADGPAYHNARRVIDWLKKSEKKYTTYESNIMMASEGDNEQIDALVNSIFSLSTIIKSKWTPRQKEIIACYLENDQNQHKASEKLGIRQSNVNRALNNASFYSYQKALETVSAVLSEVRGPDYV